MTILITGSNGFIGKALIEKMIGYHIIKYDLPDADILDEQLLEICIKHCDIVIHMAAIADLNVSQQNPDKNFDVNIKGTYNIAKYCAQYNKKLLFISTCCVYGNTPFSFEDEMSYPQTRETYACSKMAGEYILHGIPNLFYIIARIGTTYGVGQRKELFTNIVFEKIIKNDIIELHGNGRQTRNLIYIDDLVDGLLKCIYLLERTNCQEIINLCGDEQISALDCIYIAEKLLNKKCMFVNVIDRYAQIRKEDIQIKKAFQILNWYPKTKFEDGMKIIYEKEWKNARY